MEIATRAKCRRQLAKAAARCWSDVWLATKEEVAKEVNKRGKRGERSEERKGKEPATRRARGNEREWGRSERRTKNQEPKPRRAGMCKGAQGRIAQRSARAAARRWMELER
jgi:hypothetical protein